MKHLKCSPVMCRPPVLWAGAVLLALGIAFGSFGARADTPASSVVTAAVNPGQSYPKVAVNSTGWFDVGGFCKVVDVNAMPWSMANIPTAPGLPLTGIVVLIPGQAVQWEMFRTNAPAKYHGDLTTTTCCRGQSDIGTACATGTNPQPINRAYGRYGEVDSQTYNCIDSHGLPYQEDWNIKCEGTTGNAAVDNGPDGQGQWAMTTDTQTCTPNAWTTGCSASCPTTSGTTTTFDSCGNVQSVNSCTVSCCVPNGSCSGACGGGGGTDNCGNSCVNNTSCCQTYCASAATACTTLSTYYNGGGATWTAVTMDNCASITANYPPQDLVGCGGYTTTPNQFSNFAVTYAQAADYGAGYTGARGAPSVDPYGCLTETTACQSACNGGGGCHPNGSCSGACGGGQGVDNCNDTCFNNTPCAGASPCVTPWGQSVSSGGSITAYQSSTGPCVSQTEYCSNGVLSPSGYQYGSCGGGTCPTVANGTTGAYPGCNVTCNNGYTLSGSTCVPAGGGTCTPVANGTTGSYPGCTITCNSGYILSGSTCVPGTCTPVANGTTGSYPGCSITCNSGYTLSGNSCVMQCTTSTATRPIQVTQFNECYTCGGPDGLNPYCYNTDLPTGTGAHCQNQPPLCLVSTSYGSWSNYQSGWGTVSDTRTYLGEIQSGDCQTGTAGIELYQETLVQKSSGCP